MRKLLSICALTLAIGSVGAVSVQALDVAKNGITAKQAGKEMINTVVKDQYVFNNINIKLTTKLENYVTQAFVTEVNGVLKEVGLNASISLSDTGLDIKTKLFFAVAEMDEAERQASFEKLKGLAKTKLETMSAKSDEEVIKTLKSYTTSKYSTITTWVNSAGRRTVALEDSKGNVLALVSADEVDKAIEELSSYTSYEDLLYLFRIHN